MKKSLDQILQEQRSRAKLSLLICLSLLIASAVLLYAKQIMGGVFLAMGIIIGISLFVRRKKEQQELSKLGSREQAENRINSPGTEYFACFGLTLGRDFAMVEKPALRVYLFDEMVKFEVGLAGDAMKTLFLTDREGIRHPLAESRKDDGNQAEFDRAYYRVREIFAARKQKDQNA